MSKWVGAFAVLAAVLAGCGSGDDPKPASAPTATPTPEAHAEVESEHGFEKGHNRAVRDYYGAEDSHAEGNIEAEYHQPPQPATGGIGDTITLTGTNIGVRVDVTLTKLSDPVEAARAPRPGKRFVGVGLRLETTGIAMLQDELGNARLTWSGGRARALTGVRAECSNGFQRFIVVDVSRRTQGCVLFEVPAGAHPRQFQLALEQVPAVAGGRWRLG